ncbi:MAG: DUF2934 domain-containing protein [Deltaproteobacteria bacterium]
MLINGKSLTGYKLHATDGDVGKLLFFFFDEVNWKVRYLAASAGTWLGRKRVLISPSAVTVHDWANHRFDLSLSKETARTSPDVDTMEAISCQSQDALDSHYGCTSIRRGEANVRSSQEITGCPIESPQGQAGHIDDLIVDDHNWAIPYLVVDTRSWLPGKYVLVPPALIRSVSWEKEMVEVKVDREKLRNAPAYDPSYPISRDYERRLYDFYGVPGYWEDITGLIRKKAQELCNRRGCVPGHELSDWLEAEHLVKSELRRG